MLYSYLRSFVLGCVAVAFMFLLAASADAATLHVRQGGGGDCTGINECIARMSGGDTIIVHAGTYDELIWNEPGQYNGWTLSPVPNGLSESQPTTIMAAPGETVWLRPSVEYPGGSSVMELNNNSRYLTFDGININAGALPTIISAAGEYLTFQNMELTNAFHCAVYAFGKFNKYINMYVHHNAWGNHPPYGCHGFYVAGSSQLFDRLRVHDNLGYGLQFSCDSCGNVQSNSVVQNSIFYNNRGAGVSSGGPNNNIYNSIYYNNGVGIISYNKVIHNTLYNNLNGDILIGGSPEVRDNIAIGNSGKNIGPHYEGYATNASNNLCGGTGSGFGCTLQGTAGSVFVDAANGDFRLKSGSPAIGTASDGTDVGVDFSKLNAGDPIPTPTQQPTPTRGSSRRGTKSGGKR